MAAPTRKLTICIPYTQCAAEYIGFVQCPVVSLSVRPFNYPNQVKLQNNMATFTLKLTI